MPKKKYNSKKEAEKLNRKLRKETFELLSNQFAAGLERFDAISDEDWQAAVDEDEEQAE